MGGKYRFGVTFIVLSIWSEEKEIEWGAASEWVWEIKKRTSPHDTIRDWKVNKFELCVEVPRLKTGKIKWKQLQFIFVHRSVSTIHMTIFYEEEKGNVENLIEWHFLPLPSHSSDSKFQLDCIYLLFILPVSKTNAILLVSINEMIGWWWT